MKLLSITAAISAVFLASIVQADISKIVRVDQASQQFIDSQGRSRHFHGTNMVKKKFPFHADIDNFVAGYSVVDRDIQHLKDLNVNVVRLGAWLFVVFVVRFEGRFPEQFQ
jgi:endoglycosylceramidase